MVNKWLKNHLGGGKRFFNMFVYVGGCKNGRRQGKPERLREPAEASQV